MPTDVAVRAEFGQPLLWLALLLMFPESGGAQAEPVPAGLVQVGSELAQVILLQMQPSEGFAGELQPSEGIAGVMQPSEGFTRALRQSERFARGWGWDTGLTLGLGLDDKGRVSMASVGRAGAIWAAEPHFYALGLALEVGGVAKLAAGPEFEWSHLDGWFANIGLGYGVGRAFTNHLTLGYRFLGAQYQHRFFAGRPYHAAFVVLRLPFGLWWSIERASRPTPTAAVR